MDDKAKGKAKEAWGALTGDEARKEEGRAQQRKADAEEETAQRQRTSEAKKEARQAERKRDSRRSRTKVCWAASRTRCPGVIRAPGRS